MNLYIKTFPLLFVGLLAVGCGGAKHQALLDTIDSPTTRPATVEALHDDFRVAERNQVHLIATERHLKARNTFDQALALKAKGQSEKQVNEKLSQARKELDAAINFTNENKEFMSPLLNARLNALSFLESETTPNRRLQSLEGRYLNLVGNLDSRRSRDTAIRQLPQLTRDYQALTISTLQSKHLGKANSNLELAKKEGALRLVPRTLKETEDAIEKASKYIAENPEPRFTSEMLKLSREADRSSQRLVELTKQTNISSGLSPEEQSLRTEAAMTTRGEESTRLRAQSTRLQDELDGSQDRISALESKTQDYAELERINEKNKNFENVRQIFSEEEAQVSRQGNNLVISLKQINFEVNKSDIPSSAFGLLRKVQTAIQSFDNPSVVIQGHTDSTGSVELNKTLSEHRAAAVKSYFLSNRVIAAEKLLSMGYGSEKPLASNATVPGRAMNRRIDIVITD